MSDDPARYNAAAEQLSRASTVLLAVTAPSKIAAGGKDAGKVNFTVQEGLVVPGSVQSRINIANGPTRYTPIDNAGVPVNAGWEHVVYRHFNGNNTQSQFTLSQTEIKNILQSDLVVSTPITEVKMINGVPTYVRTVDVGYPIGTVRQADGGGLTSNLYIQTDSAGNLITTYTIPLGK
jgi:filamentous hemagglutinin